MKVPVEIVKSVLFVVNICMIVVTDPLQEGVREGIATTEGVRRRNKIGNHYFRISRVRCDANQTMLVYTM